MPEEGFDEVEVDPMRTLLVVLVALCALVTGCASQGDLKAAQERSVQMEAKVAQLEGDLKKAQEDLAKAQADLKTLTAERDALKGVQASPSPSGASPSSKPGESASGSPPATPVSPVARDVHSDWIGNGTVSLKVDKLEEIRDLDALGDLIRVGTADKDKIQDYRSRLSGGKEKLVVLYASMRNDTPGKIHLGYNLSGGITAGNVVHFGLWIRGEEGTEYDSLHTCDVTYYLKEGFPMDSEAPAHGVVSGRLAYWTADWFKPTKFFLKANDSYPPAIWGNGGKKPELVVRL